MAKKSKQWANKITGYGEEDPTQLLANSHNYRIHPKFQQDALSGVLNEVGWVDDVIVNRRTSEEWGADRGVETVLDGHLRVSLAISRDEPTVPVKYVDLTPDEEALILATFDPIGALAVADAEVLADLLAQVRTEDEAVQRLLDEVASEAGIAIGDEPPEDPGPQIDRGKALAEEYGTAVGQIWQCGQHRLAVGDCLDESVIAELMWGEKAVLSCQDPPYGADVVKVKGRTGKGSIGGDNWGAVGEYTPIVGDDRPFDPSHLLHSGEIVVLWGANYYADRLPPSACWLVWDKREGVASNNFADCELAWVNRPGPARLFTHKWMGMLKASEHGQKRWHPTQKPVALFEWVMSLFTKPGDVVADWYCGSGSQLVAGERCGRPVRACEIVPEYVAISLRRWEDLTGEKAVLLTNLSDQGNHAGNG